METKYDKTCSLCDKPFSGNLPEDHIELCPNCFNLDEYLFVYPSFECTHKEETEFLYNFTRAIRSEVSIPKLLEYTERLMSKSNITINFLINCAEVVSEYGIPSLKKEELIDKNLLLRLTKYDDLQDQVSLTPEQFEEGYKLFDTPEVSIDSELGARIWLVLFIEAKDKYAEKDSSSGLLG